VLFHEKNFEAIHYMNSSIKTPSAELKVGGSIPGRNR